MKKLLVLLVFAVSAAFVNAQTINGAVGNGSVGASSATVSPVQVGTGVTYPTIAPPPSDSGFVEFDNLVVQGVSSMNVPAEITATSENYPLPMTGVNSTGPAIAPGTSGVSRSNCFKFPTRDTSSGHAIPCPLPPSTAPAPASPQPSSNGPASNINTMPAYYFPKYRIEVSSPTQLYLRDRTSASLADFTNGDHINVYGFYNTDGSIQAYLIRNTSKPLQTQTFQLNNVRIVSISASTTPATLAVVQTQSAPCYLFNNNSGGAKQSYACPMGISSFSNNTATANVATPSALMPQWQMLRKYVVNIDAKTILLNNQRATLSLADLKVNDSINIYGATSDNGQTVNADIVRDLSQPPVPTTYRGNVTQVNTDGSFVVQTNEGQIFTVQNPVGVGMGVTITGLLDPTQNILSQISGFTMGNNQFISPGFPIPIPMMQGGAPSVKK